MTQERIVPASKPILDERAFHKLLCAAYTLQQRQRDSSGCVRHSSAEPAAPFILPINLSQPDFGLSLPGVAATAKHELTKFSADPVTLRNGLLVRKSPLTIARRGPKIWRTVEALVIGTVFCSFMVSAAIPWFTSHAGGAVVLSSPAVLPKTQQAPSVMRLSSKGIDRPENLTRARHAQAGTIARDTVTRYMNLPAIPRIRAGISGGAPMSGPKRSGFARDGGMIASDTVLRYDKDFNSPRKPATGKALPTIPESLRSSAR